MPCGHQCTDAIPESPRAAQSNKQDISHRYVELLWAVEDDNTLFTCCLVWGDNGLHQMAAGIALVEVAIGKTQTNKRTAKAAVIDFSTRAQGVNGKPARCAHRNWPSTLTVPAGSL